MNNQTERQTRILINFQIGRGGRFNNGGHLSVNGIGDTTLGHITEKLNYDYSKLQEAIADMEDAARDEILDATCDAAAELENILNKHGLHLADIGDRCYTDYNGEVYELPNEDGYSFNFDNEYDTSYGVYVSHLNDLSADQLGALQAYGSFYDIEELLTDEQYILVSEFDITIEDALGGDYDSKLKEVTEDEHYEEKEDGVYKSLGRGKFYFLAA